tara:strand:+ start:754 stop:1245 length:492 start_codon:yes stop_codon:yes gene_type:complete
MLSETRKMLKPYSHVVLETMDVNQVASSVGHTAEYILIKHFKWSKNGDIGNEKGYDAVDKKGNKIEIKSMSYESEGNYVPYIHSKKEGGYDYLAILHFNEKRVAIIPAKVISKFIKENTLPGRKSKSLRLVFSDPILTKLGKPRKKSLFLSLFLKYEDKNFKF